MRPKETTHDFGVAVMKSTKLQFIVLQLVQKLGRFIQCCILKLPECTKAVTTDQHSLS